MVPSPSTRTGTADEVLIEDFVRRHQRGLWRALRAMGCPAADAEDCAQEAFVLGLERGWHLDVDAAAAGRSLRTAARFLWLRRRRDASRRERRLIERAATDWERDSAHDDGDGWLAALERCLAGLPERSRRALELRYRDGAGREVIARELGIGEHGVRSLLQRLRAALRSCIERRRVP